MAKKYDETINVFISSVPEDELLLNELKKFLKGLGPKISIWDDSNIPLGEPREIPEGAVVHQSVLERLAESSYKPVNLPSTAALVIQHDPITMEAMVAGQSAKAMASPLPKR